MMAKIHELQHQTILAVCDKIHVGKLYEDEKFSFHVREKFYADKEITEEELITLLREANSANLFGDKCVGIALKQGLISEQSIIKICGIKHAQIYHM